MSKNVEYINVNKSKLRGLFHCNNTYTSSSCDSAFIYLKKICVLISAHSEIRINRILQEYNQDKCKKIHEPFQDSFCVGGQKI